MNKQEWLKNTLQSKKKKALPILSFPCVQLLNVSVKDLISNSDTQADGILAIAERYDTAGAVSMMDLSVEAEAFGSQIHFSDDEVPTVIGRIIETPEDAINLKVPAVGTARTGVFVEAIKKTKEKLTDRPLFAGVIGPFSLAGRLMDMTEIMMNCYIEPDMVHETLKKVSEFITNYILEFKKAGADGVIMAEPAGGLLSPDLHREFSAKYVKEIIDKVSDDSFLFVYHNCANVVPLADDIFSLGADAYHFGNAINLKDMLDIADSNTIIMGNIDPVSCFRSGTEDFMREQTSKLLTELHNYPNFVVSSGCDIPPVSKLENIDAFFSEVKKFYA